MSARVSGPGAGADAGDLAVPAVRRLLAVAAVLVFLAGLQLFVFPHDTATHFAWTIASPMTAVFLGASYWSAVGLELSGALARRWSVARVAVPAVFVFTTLTLVVTVVHLDRFHLAADLPGTTRAVTWGWIAVYAVVPVLMVLAWVAQARSGTAVPAPAGLPTPVRLTLVALAVVLVGLGVALLVAPGWADAAWPWPLTPLTARAVGAWCVGLGVAAGHARLVDDARSLGPIGVTGVLFGVLQALALARYGSELDWSSPAAVGYVVVVAAIGAVGAWLLVAARGAPPD
ncbi:hypothetical protein GCM10023168_06170 [Fodinibacter luteus]|uniref:Uncharacterized protein n=1 Tax=Fodinibacter luteus TaxID=552064 RepID=A0ABP8K1L2_9MICO